VFRTAFFLSSLSISVFASKHSSTVDRALGGGRSQLRRGRVRLGRRDAVMSKGVGVLEEEAGKESSSNTTAVHSLGCS